MRRRSLLTVLLGIALALGGCSGPDTGPIGTMQEATTGASNTFNWSRFPDWQQCIVGVDMYYSSVYGASVNPGLCGLPSNGACASCGACLVWLDNTPDPTKFDRFAWGTTTPQAEDIVIFPPYFVSGASQYGHAAVVDHWDGSTLWIMDDNWNGDTRKANCTYADYVCGHVHPAYGRPYGIYRLKSKETAPYAAAWAGQSYPSDMTSGDVIAASLDYKNQGTATWDGNTRIGTVNPRDRSSAFADPSWIGPGRPVSVSASTPPGAIGHFPFVLHAPDVSTDTVFTEDWGLVQEGVTWFGPPDGAVWFKITVHPRWSASYSASSYVTQMVSGQNAVAWIDMTNTGTTTWDGNTRLGTAQPNDRVSDFYDPATWLTNARPAAVQSSTPPGMTGHFAFRLHAPDVTTPTTFVEHWGVVEEGTTWLRTPDVSFQIEVYPAGEVSSSPTPVAAATVNDPSVQGGCSAAPGSPASGASAVLLLALLGVLGAEAARRRRARGEPRYRGPSR